MQLSSWVHKQYGYVAVILLAIVLLAIVLVGNCPSGNCPRCDCPLVVVMLAIVRTPYIAELRVSYTYVSGIERSLYKFCTQNTDVSITATLRVAHI